MEIVPKHPTRKGPADMFTGDVLVDLIAKGVAPSELNVNAVHFAPGARRPAPGARSAWHVHSQGQTLYVVEGKGLVQSRGEKITEIAAGDVIYTPEGEEHWHGAAPDHLMTHLSITEGGIEWHAHVTDAE